MCTKLQLVREIICKLLLLFNFHSYYWDCYAKILHFRLQKKKKIISSYKNKRILLEKLKQRLRLSTLAIRTYDRNILQ